MKLIITILFSITTTFSFAQTECNELEKLKQAMDSVDIVLQQHKADFKFLKDSIVPFLEMLKLWNTNAKVVLTTKALLFEFDEINQPNLEAISLDCLDVFAKNNGFKIKNSKPDGNGFRIKSVFKKKNDDKSLLFIARGAVYNRTTKSLEQNRLYLTYKWQYYSN